MATIPVMDSSVNLAAGQSARFSAPGVEPIRGARPAPLQGPLQLPQAQENFAARQMMETGRAVGQAADTMLNIAVKVQDEINDAKTKEADTIFADRMRERLFSSDGGYFNSRGKNAVDNQQAALDDIVDARREVENMLENDLQRQMFKATADRRMLAARTDIDKHAFEQLKVYNVAESKARIDNLLQDATVNAQNWSVEGSQYKMFSTAMRAEVKELARLSGVKEGTAQYDAVMRGATTKLHETVIGKFLSEEQPKMAAAYLKAHKGEIEAERLDNITKAVRQAEETVGVKEDSLRLSMSLKGSAQDQVSQVDQMFKDGKIGADLRDATVQRIEHTDSRRRAAKAEYEANLIGQAQEWLIKNPNASVMDMPTGMYQQLRNSGRLDSIISFAKNGRYITDPKAAAEVMGMTAEQFAAMTPTEYVARYRTRLDDSDFNYGLAKVHASRGTATAQHLEIISTGDRVEATAKQLGILPKAGKPSGSQATEFDAFRKNVNERVLAFEQGVLKGQRKANGQELQQILDGVVLDKAQVPGMIWGSSPKPVSMMTPKELETAFVIVGNEQVPLASIPLAQRRIIIQKLTARGRTVTEQEIANLWVAAGKPR